MTGDEKTGVRIVAASLSQPLRSIAENAGETGGVIAAHAKEQPDRPRLQRGDRGVARPCRRRHHRPGQGDSLGPGERGVDRRATAHDGGHRRGEAGRATAAMPTVMARHGHGHGHGHGHSSH